MPGRELLSEDTDLGTEENTAHTSERALGCGNSGDSETRLTEDKDISVEIEDDNTYAIDVPLADMFHCRICEPIPKWYKRYGDLSKHIRRYHARRLIFRYHGCSEVFVALKGCKRHQSTTYCGKLPVVAQVPPPPPLAQQTNTLAVRRCRLPNSSQPPQPCSALETSNIVQTGDTETSGTDPTSQQVKASDSNPRASTEYAESGIVLNSQFTTTDGRTNSSATDCVAKRPEPETTAERLRKLNEWQPNGYTDSIALLKKQR